MKQFLFVVTLWLLITTLHAQSFTGYNSGNYTGVNGVFFNPAYAANSRYHWDFNLFQLNVSVYNNAASYKLSSLTKNFNSNEVLNKLYSSNNASAQVNADILGPSMLFSINSKTAFAITTRYRVAGNLRGVNGTLLQAIKGEDAPASFNVSNNNMKIGATGWMEAGVTWANVLYCKDKHFLKAGISLKYLGGITNASINTHNLNAAVAQDVNKDSYLASNASGNIDLSFAGVSAGNINTKDLTKFDGTGAGFDIGLSYEYRPNSSRYKQEDGSYDRSKNIYKLRASLALLDVGSIRFTKNPQRSGSYTAGINSNSFDLNALNSDIDSIKNTFEANPAFFTPDNTDNTGNSGNYKVSLPTAIMAEVDYHLNKGFYINLATHLALAGSSDAYKINSLTNIVLTPRLETPAVGIYLPMQVNNLSGFNAGVGLRLGSLVIGSSNILTALSSSKMADFYIGLRLMGSKQKKE